MTLRPTIAGLGVAAACAPGESPKPTLEAYTRTPIAHETKYFQFPHTDRSFTFRYGEQGRVTAIFHRMGSEALGSCYALPGHERDCPPSSFERYQLTEEAAQAAADLARAQSVFAFHLDSINYDARQKDAQKGGN